MDATLSLPATFDVTVVRQVYEALRRALEAPGELCIDGRAVEHVDAAGGQLLAALTLSGRAVHLDASPALADFLTSTALNVVIPSER
jgi:anti-anti-sigma regulatory factor